MFTVINIDSATPIVEAFGSDPAGIPAAGGPPLSIAAPSVTEITGVPEPATVMLTGVGLCIAGLMRRRVRR